MKCKFKGDTALGGHHGTSFARDLLVASSPVTVTFLPGQKIASTLYGALVPHVNCIGKVYGLSCNDVVILTQSCYRML